MSDDKVYGRNQTNMLSSRKATAEDEILSGKYEMNEGPEEALEDINKYLNVFSDNRYGSKAETIADVYKAHGRAGPKKFKKKTEAKEFRNGGSISIKNFKGSF